MFHVCRQKQSDRGRNIYGIGAGFKQIAGVDSATVWGVGYDGKVWQNHHGIWTGADFPDARRKPYRSERIGQSGRWIPRATCSSQARVACKRRQSPRRSRPP